VRVLVVNAGSSSLKLSLLDGDDMTLAACELDARGAQADPDALAAALGEGGLSDADAVGHRVVHGGTRFTAPVVVDDAAARELEALIDLAPLHQPKSLAAMRAVSAALPERPAVACFDTAFHATLPLAAATYALPAAWRERWRLRRFGFHGISHAWIARQEPQGRVVSCHLGAGASLCAIADGRSVDTTMGFTPLEGLVMATRSGSVDPGLLLWLEEHERIAARDLAETLEQESGLVGLAGTPDMRKVLERAAAGDDAAVLARDVYVHRLAASIAAMTAALGGLDALVFTGGVGEHSAEIRERACARLAHLGVGDGGPVRVRVIPAREDLEIARQVREVLSHRDGT
jgi:acetate kinase